MPRHGTGTAQGTKEARLSRDWLWPFRSTRELHCSLHSLLSSEYVNAARLARRDHRLIAERYDARQLGGSPDRLFARHGRF